MAGGKGSGGFAWAQATTRSIHEDFLKFQSYCPLHKFYQPRWDVEWCYYQAGPAWDENPLVFLHGTSGTAAAFFYQVQALSEKGYRVLSLQYPAFSDPVEWSKGFDLLMDSLKCKAAHIFGAGLGGFLAQHLAARFPHRVKSLILCNAFATTHTFADRAGALAGLVSLMPTPLLRQAMLDAFPEGGMELLAKQAIDWVAQQVNSLSGNDLASRLSLNCTPSCVGPAQLSRTSITLMESNGETMVPEELRRQLRGLYQNCRVAQLKGTGDFPYLSRPEEVTLFIEVHMRGVGVFHGGSEGLSCVSSSEIHEVTLGNGRHHEDDDELDKHLPRYSPQAAEAAEASPWDDSGCAPELVAAPPPRKPVWKNPFEDDPLL